MTKSSKPNVNICDTVAHNPTQLKSSRSKDARALRSGLALQTALLALLEEKNFDHITVRDICAKAGVHYSTFFRHHPTKEALLDAIAKEEINELSKLTKAIRQASDFRAGFLALCTYVEANQELWATLLNGGAGPAMREEWLRQSMEEAANEHSAHAWLPIELGTICAASLIAETIAWWLNQPRGKHSAEEMTETLMRLLNWSFDIPQNT